MKFHSSSMAALMVLASGLWAGSVHANYLEQKNAQSFIDRMVTKHGFEREQVTGLIAQAEKKQSILDAIAKPAEKRLEWSEYRKIFIQETRIAQGLEFWNEHRATLQRASEVYGVPPQIIVAIIGVETRYGRNKGSYRVLDALATLGFDYPPRGKFFTGQLEEYLLMVREQGLDPLELTGSYAGAMGYGQFIPSSYRSFAVDFDGDKVADIVHNPVDAIGSVANYFNKHGWKTGALVALPATADKGHDPSVFEEGMKPTLSIAELASKGVRPYQALPAGEKASAFLFQGEQGAEYWVGLNNFYVITRYNHSPLYAMAVYQLSQLLEQRAAK